MSLAASRIITKGLGGRACEGIITTHFSLYCTTPPAPRVNRGGIGGGQIPPSNFTVVPPRIRDLYDEDDDTQQLQYHKVIFDIKVGKHNIHREYTVPKKREPVVLKIFKLINITSDKFTVNIRNIRKINKIVTIGVTNFAKRLGNKRK